MDRLMSKPNYEDLMNVVDKQNRFVVSPEGQEEATQKLKELKAFKGRQAIQDVTEAKQWKKEDMALSKTGSQTTRSDSF